VYRLTFLTALALVPAARADQPAPDPRGVEFFEKHVRPVLVEKCIGCHGPKTQRGSLRLDSRDALLKGGDTGPAVVAGQPDKSLLVRAGKRDGDLKMPPKEKDRLTPAQVDALSAWVRMGAPWPAGTSPAAAGSSTALARKSHWSFRPVSRPPLPAVRDANWPLTPVDRFILAKLDAKGLTPAPAADRRTLLRRVTFDLTGLPPTPEEVEAFVKDSRPDAYERLVDRLLASPAYGERWGRHWLDVARYADTRGYVFTAERLFPYSYTYRDYVIASFNEDRPYDRFVVEQLAADQVDLGEDRRPLAAMGYLTLGRRFLNNVHDIIDDRIDVVMRGLQGLTVSCARCHDHKFDPIPTRDYYSLYGVFASSTEPAELPLLVRHDPSAGPTPFQKELQARQEKVDRFLKERHAELLPRFRAQAGSYLLAARNLDRPRGDRRLGPDDLNRALLRRWREYLRAARKGHHPVLAPFLAFAALAEKDYPAKAAALAAQFAANREPGKPINPLVAKAFAASKPASLVDVTRLYDQLFKDTDTHWQEALRTATAEKRLAPVRLPDADREAIRQVLYGPGAPTNITPQQFEPFLDRAMRNLLTPLRKKVEQWRATAPGAPPRAMVLVDMPAPVNPHVLVRGNPNNPGVAVPRQFLEVLSPQPRRPFAKGSGRLELARAIASRDNPLTARVMVNRVWMHHFGQGLVRTPGDFGLRGEPPTHPELLDWLAVTFVESGWSVKTLHRLMVLSAAYRQSSEEAGQGAVIDSDNNLLWRMNRRRLEFEPLRDALLASAGRLDRRLGGQPVQIAQAPFTPRRSVYGFIDRQNLPGLFRTFDLASPDTSTPQRHSTTVPQQALFLMNGPFVVEHARALAARPDVVTQKSDEARIDRLHQIAYGRPADHEEVSLGLSFVRQASTKSGGLTAWEQYAQVILLANEFAFVD
jgi:mono/diheme cytochrome c family protein